MKTNLALPANEGKHFKNRPSLFSPTLTLTRNSISWIAIVTKHADLTLKAVGVVEAVEAPPISHVTDWPQGWVHVTVTPAGGAATNLKQEGKQFRANNALS